MFAGAADEVDAVLEDDLADVHGLDGLHRTDEVGNRSCGRVINQIKGRAWHGPAAFVLQAHGELALQDYLFIFPARVAEAVEEHKPIKLGFGEFERAGLLDGILRRNDKEGSREREGLPPDGHLAFLHRFEHRALDLGGGPIDFIGEQEVGKNRPTVNPEIARLLIDDFRAHDVGGQHIDRKLNALEIEVNGFGERVDEERFGEARHTLQEEMAAREEGDHHPLDDDVLADDDFGDALAHLSHESLGRFGLRRWGGRGISHGVLD